MKKHFVLHLSPKPLEESVRRAIETDEALSRHTVFQPEQAPEEPAVWVIDTRGLTCARVRDASRRPDTRLVVMVPSVDTETCEAAWNLRASKVLKETLATEVIQLVLRAEIGTPNYTPPSDGGTTVPPEL